MAAAGVREISSTQWLRLAEAREPTALADARRAATAADRLDDFAEQLTDLRDRNRRRPSFMTMLDRAGLR